MRLHQLGCIRIVFNQKNLYGTASSYPGFQRFDSMNHFLSRCGGSGKKNAMSIGEKGSSMRNFAV